MPSHTHLLAHLPLKHFMEWWDCTNFAMGKLIHWKVNGLSKLLVDGRKDATGALDAEKRVLL